MLPEPKDNGVQNKKPYITPRPRPDVISGQTKKKRTGCGNLYVTLNVDEDGRLFELFCRHGKTGGCASAQMEALGMVFSKALRARVDPHSICRAISGIRCPNPRVEDGKITLSCPDAIAQVIEATECLMTRNGGFINPRPRPDVISGQTKKKRTGCGDLYVTLNVDEEGKLFELFCRHGKTGGCGSAQMEALGIVISKALRARVDPHSICKGISGIRCPSPFMEGNEMILSCPDAIAQVIEEYLQERSQVNEETKEDQKMQRAHG